MNTPTYITIRSTHGASYVDRKTGDVISRSRTFPIDDSYRTIYHFDLDEYFAWDKGSDRETCEHIDICGINYTYRDERGDPIVEPFSAGWRENVEEARNEGLFYDIDYYESSMDSTACELIQHSTDKTKELYYIFSKALQADLRAKFGDVFKNF